MKFIKISLLNIFILCFSTSNIFGMNIYEQKHFDNWTSCIVSDANIKKVTMFTSNNTAFLRIDFLKEQYHILLGTPSTINPQDSDRPIPISGNIHIDSHIFSDIRYMYFFEKNFFYVVLANVNKNIIKKCINGNYVTFNINDPFTGKKSIFPFNFSLYGFSSAYNHAKKLVNKIYKNK